MLHGDKFEKLGVHSQLRGRKPEEVGPVSGKSQWEGGAWCVVHGGAIEQSEKQGNPGKRCIDKAFSVADCVSLLCRKESSITKNRKQAKYVLQPKCCLKKSTKIDLALRCNFDKNFVNALDIDSQCKSSV